MKNILIVLLFITTVAKAQTILKFNTTPIMCEDKWVVYPMGKDSTHAFGFVYLDAVAGLTLNYEGTLKIDNDGDFHRTAPVENSKVGFIKYRLEPNPTLIAELPESQFTALNLQRIPDWLSSYSKDENSASTLFSRGFMCNAWNQFEKALGYLEKVEKLDASYNGLQTEMAFSYNALNKFELAQVCLEKAIKSNPKDSYSYKELAYTFTQSGNLKKAAETYDILRKVAPNPKFLQETAANIAVKYFMRKDKISFNKWKLEAEKWLPAPNQIATNLAEMEKKLSN